MNDAVERAASALGCLEAENAKLLDSVTRAVSIEADGRPQYKLAVGDQLEVLESNLGGLLYSEDSNLGTESETDEEVKLEVLTTTSSLPTLAPFRQDVERSKNIGTRRVQKLIVRFEGFRRSQADGYRRKLNHIRLKSGIDKIHSNVESKERQVDKLSFELRSKLDLLDEAKNGQERELLSVALNSTSTQTSSVNLVETTHHPRGDDSQDPTNSVTTLSEKEMIRLGQVIKESHQRISELFLKEQLSCDHELLTVREELGELVLTSTYKHDWASTVKAHHSVKKLARLRFKKSKVTDPNYAELILLEDAWKDLAAVVDKVATVQKSIAATESELKVTLESIDVLKRRENYRELQRIRDLCQTLQLETKRKTALIPILESKILIQAEKQTGSAIPNLICSEGLRLLQHYRRRNANRISIKNAAAELRIRDHIPRSKPKPKMIALPVVTHRLEPNEVTLALQVGRLLKKELTSRGVTPTDIILHSWTLPPERQGGRGVNNDFSQTAVPGTTSLEQAPRKNAAALQVLQDMEDEGEEADELEDFGLPAILEQLQTLEDLILSGPKRYSVPDSSDVLEEIRDELEDSKAVIVDLYTLLRKTAKEIAKLFADNSINTVEQRDILRNKFLKKIGGREGMPLSTRARADEVKTLTDFLLEVQTETRSIKKDLALKAAQIESAYQLYTELKATPGLASQGNEIVVVNEHSPSRLVVKVEMTKKTLEEVPREVPRESLREPPIPREAPTPVHAAAIPETAKRPSIKVEVKLVKNMEAPPPEPREAEVRPPEETSLPVSRGLQTPTVIQIGSALISASKGKSNNAHRLGRYFTVKGVSEKTAFR